MMMMMTMIIMTNDDDDKDDDDDDKDDGKNDKGEDGSGKDIVMMKKVAFVGFPSINACDEHIRSKYYYISYH